MRTLITLTVIGVLSGWSVSLKAHQSWISNGGFKNSAGEWCCGEHDCSVVEARPVVRYRYLLTDPVQGQGETGYEIFGTGEFVPQSETMPSPDGAYWRCHRPDGSRRCFFAPMQVY